MAYDEFLAERIGRIFSEKKVAFEAKKMMGGLCYLVDGKMCVGVVKGEIMARVGPEAYQSCLGEEGCKEMNFTGRAMKGFVFVESSGVDMDEDLAKWIQRCIDHNPFANRSKKKKKKVKKHLPNFNSG